MKTNRIQHLCSMVVIGILAGLCSWVAGAVFHSFILREGTLSVNIFSPALTILWHRLALAVCFVGLGAYAQHLLAGRRKAESAFRQSEERYRILLENISDGILIADIATQKFVEVNKAMCDMLGYGREELIGVGIETIHPPEDLPFVLSEFQRTIRNNEKIATNMPVMRKNGAVFYADIGHTTVTLNNAPCAVGIFRDITGRKEVAERIKRVNEDLERRVVERTVELEDAVARLNKEIIERKQTEAALRESWIKFRQLAENIREVFWIRDVSTRQILYISPAYEELWGRTCRSLYERPESFLECVHPDDAKRVSAAVARLHDGSSYAEEYRIIRPDNSTSWIRARTFPVKNEQGEITRIVGIAEDITDRKNAELVLRTHADQLQAFSSRLVDVREAERQFLARELHDEIGQQLTGLKLSLDMMKRIAPETLTRQLHETQTIAADLLERVRNLSLDLRPSMLDDLGLLPALTWHFERYRNQTGIQVVFKHEGLKRRPGLSVETAIYRVIQESLTNVARHAGAKEVSVSLSSNRTGLHLSIADCGTGFDPCGVRRQTVGLFSMRERIEAVGGRLTIQAAPSAGTLVTATVPLHDGQGGEA